jgi:hypothetical protein
MNPNPDVRYVARAIGVGRDLWGDDRVRLLAAYYEPCVTFTSVLADAMIFESSAAALEFTQQVYAAVPVRSDGKPNRPLSAYFWQFVPVESARRV